MPASGFLAITDERLVERLIPALQQAIAEMAGTPHVSEDGTELVGISVPDVANVLLMLLASLLEQTPECATPRGLRLTAEAAGKELAELMRDARRVRLADRAEPEGLQ